MKEATLVDALTKKKAQAGGETINMPLSLANVRTCFAQTWRQSLEDAS